ncbi:ATPase [Hymenobacter sp. RP-2-7]|uniref:ATPase n=1 Tax=Hymenobacter polaris TaxID=2682546 RepID=A0A7Y0ABX9_9BACT|nr:START-like domain-containing protein [Hymenobacter polaris]NML64503.1 ATPase [Hymenobacter polaris]
MPELVTSKRRFEREYAINASPRILFPYIASASGLAQWFCDAARLDPDHRLTLVWDQQNHYAEVTAERPGRSIRYVFLDEHKQPKSDASYLDLTLESSRITQEVFLRVTDYSSHSDEEQLELWEGLVHRLREQVSGEAGNRR